MDSLLGTFSCDYIRYLMLSQFNNHIVGQRTYLASYRRWWTRICCDAFVVDAVIFHVNYTAHFTFLVFYINGFGDNPCVSTHSGELLSPDMKRVFQLYAC
jgi:hypothetical protein